MHKRRCRAAITAAFIFMDNQEDRKRFRAFLANAESGKVSAPEMISEAWSLLSWNSTLAIGGLLLSLCGLAFWLGTKWMPPSEPSPQPPVGMQQVGNLMLARCSDLRDISRLPEPRARLLGDHIDILRQDTQAAKFSRLFVLESGTLDHSYSFGWTLETWDGTRAYDLMVSAAYLDQEIEGHESFTPLKLVRSQQR